MGSDTCGSIRIPAANNNLFGIRVTQGFSSRDGIIPLSHTQDVGGPLARSMIDLALILDATVGHDPNDPQTAVAEGKGPASFAALANQGTLDGLRLGLLKSHLSDKTPFEEMTKVVMSAVTQMTEQGAETVEFEIEGLEEMIDGFGVIGMELSADMEAYFKASNAPVKSLADVLESGLYHAVQEPRYRDPIRGDATLEDYPERFARREVLARAINDAMDEHDVDVLVYPTLRVKPRRIEEGQFGSSCQISAQSGHPALTMPAGLTPDGVPVGIELLAKPFEDDKLVAIAFAYEKIAMTRQAPSRTPSLVSDTLSADFSLQSQQISGDLRLDKATQTLHYELTLQGIDEKSVSIIALHRSVEYTNGPVIDLLGIGLTGSVAVRNADLDDLLDDGLYIAVYSHDGREAVARGQVVSRVP
jgi:Asp-tRNA(Asn)/Glu-tRNA(Gln) amidotransferase A subunit family amidase